MYKEIKGKIANKSAKIGVIGLGYVGLPLAVLFAEQKFEVTGIDTSQKRVKSIKNGKSYIMDIPTKTIAELTANKFLDATVDYSVVKQLDVIIICVPTPLSKTKEPDISFIMSAIKNIIKNRKRGQLYVLESTTYPGTTEEMLLPKFEEDGFKKDVDFFLAFSPERVDPRNKTYTTSNIPKVVGGVTRKSTMLTRELYSKIVEEVIPVTSSKVAEMAKLLENTFRSVNIGLVNELALMCEALHIDVWEVIDAAKTKPFGFMPFYPGPGIGGHCINIDPLYLSWKASLHGFNSRFIEIADNINSSMPRYVVNRVISALNKKRKPVKGCKILILGVTYKKDINDTRESPSFEILRLFREEEAEVSYHDPYIPTVRVDGHTFKSLCITDDILKKQDCVILATDHSSLDYKQLKNDAKLIFDTRNAFKQRGIVSKKIIRL
ncbi:MAG: nucleotide sugar dehydrogenase [Candidatus Omnitrophica bacterium]|nr:nucleotide sugar dehydrogenase [Candidatus Omnitrophota bacterium]